MDTIPTIPTTPLQEMILEVLAARHRLGEHVWTFERNGPVTMALLYLAKVGLIEFKHGVVEKTYLAWLTDAGRGQQLSDNYQTPRGRCATCPNP